MGCFPGWGCRWEAGAGQTHFFSADIWPEFSSPGYVTPEENSTSSPTPLPFLWSSSQASCFAENVYFGSCFHLTYIKHSHKAEASCRVQSGLLTLCAFSVSRVRKPDKQVLRARELRLKWPRNLTRASSDRKRAAWTVYPELAQAQAPFLFHSSDLPPLGSRQHWSARNVGSL